MTISVRHHAAVGLFLCAFAVLTIRGLPLSAQDSEVDPVATREYAVALGFQKKKLFEQAAVRWTQFIATFGRDKRIPNAHYHLGVCQLQTGKPEATETFRRVLQQFPAFEQRDAVQFNLGLSLYNGALGSKKPEDYRAASAEFAKVSAEYGQSSHVPGSLYYQAECVYQAGDRAGAIVLYQRLVSQFGNSELLPAVLMALGTTQQEVEQHAEAAQTFRLLLEKFPNDLKVGEARLRLGLALTALQKYEEAEREFAATAGMKDFALADLALFHQGRTKNLQNQFPQAAELFESLGKKFPDSEYRVLALLEGGKCRFAAKQYPEARATLTSVVDAKKDESAEAAWWLGRTMIQMKQSPAAIGLLDQAIAEWPQSEFHPALTFTRIEAIYEDEQRRPETVALYAQFADRFAANELAADARFRSALTALQLNDSVTAGQQSDAFIANAALSKHPLMPDSLYVAAESRVVGEAPDFPKAEAFYRRLIAEFPEHQHVKRSHVRIGLCLYSVNQYDPAIQFLTSSFPKLMEPELLAEAQFLIGLSHVDSKRLTEGIAALQASRQAKADWIRGDEVCLALATALADISQPDAAIEELNRLNQQYPKSEFGDRAWYQLGEIQSRLKKFDPADAAYRQVIARFPASAFAPRALYGSALALFDKGDYPAAINQLNAVLQQYATSDAANNAMYLRGLSQHRQKNFPAAIADLQQYLKQNPPDENGKSDAQYSLALCHAGLKQHDQTILVANELLRTKPDYRSADKVWYELAFALTETGKLMESAESFRSLATKYPDSELAAESWLRVGDFHVSEGKFAESIAAFEQGLAKAKEPQLQERLRYRKGSAQFSMDAFPEAVTTLQAQVTDHPAGELGIDASWLIAEGLFRQKKYEESTAWYQKVIESKRDVYVARSLYRMGTCNSELKRWPTAQQHFDALTKQFPKFEQISEARYGLGFAMQNQNQLDQASQVYEQVTRETNTETAAKARFMMGECAFAKNQYEVAWQHFLEAALGYPYPEWQALGHFEAARCFIELKMPDKARESLQTVVEKFPEHPRAKDCSKLLEQLK